MIYTYGFSMVGKSHVSMNTECQDSNRILKMNNGWYIAAVADGVGSAKNSKIGSKIATDTVVDFCNKYMPWDYSTIGIKSMIRTAYNHAFKRIMQEAEKAGEPIESYDTTLSMVIYDGRRIVYGHAGDGAIFGLNTFGDYVEITRPQKGPDGVSVVPLRAGYTQWEIGEYEEDLASVMLMTDGILSTICPYLLRNTKITTDEVYVPLATFFADPKGIPENEKKQKRTRRQISEFLAAAPAYDANHFYERLAEIYQQRVGEQAAQIVSEFKALNFPIALMENEQDDKTLVALINTELPVDDREPSFYSEPDWEALKEAWNRKAYPHLYHNEDSESAASSENTNTPTEMDQSASAPVDSQTCDGSQNEEKQAQSVESMKEDKPFESGQSILAGKGNMAETKAAGKSSPPICENPVTMQTGIARFDAKKHPRPKKKGLLGKIGDLLGE